jgi:DNA-binding transcriptional MerR regulator|tara:strand:- start:360 stop:920 length:561 start_codon:yes stop_codon:yes gene_type:complete
MTTPVKIPKQSVYKAAEVCALAKLQPYVLRSWEAEFPDLGVAPKGSAARIYRRTDLEKVLRIKELLFVEGLTLGAARRKILKETPATDETEQLLLEELGSGTARERVEGVKAGLQSILELLSVSGNGDAVSATSPRVEGKDAPATPGRARAPKSKKTSPARSAPKAGTKTKVGAKRARKQPAKKKT